MARAGDAVVGADDDVNSPGWLGRDMRGAFLDGDLAKIWQRLSILSIFKRSKNKLIRKKSGGGCFWWWCSARRVCTEDIHLSASARASHA
jgi:hypothetical protein